MLNDHIMAAFFVRAVRSSLRRNTRQLVNCNRGLGDVAAYFDFQRAIVGSPASINQKFADHALRIDQPTEPIDVRKAKQQHAAYVSELRKLIPQVIEVPFDDRFPDQVFVEEPAVCLDGTALMTQMRPVSRAREVEPMRPVLESMGFSIVEMREYGAYLDGGDVLFTGREFLIGLTQRTNSAGIEEFSRAFPSWPVSGINVPRGILHLKSLSSLAGIDLLAIGDSEAGKKVWREIETKAHFKYDKLVFPDNNGANCLFVNGVVLHPSKEDYPRSYEVWETLKCPRVSISNSELAKADGSLTCNSIRIFEK